MQHNFVFQLTFYPFQDKINNYYLTVYNHDIVQIHSRQGSHFVSHSDTVQIRSRYGCHSVTHSNSDFQIQFGYATDTDAILILIQVSRFRYSSDTLQTLMPF